jgi:hypothetical protein
VDMPAASKGQIFRRSAKAGVNMPDYGENDLSEYL